MGLFNLFGGGNKKSLEEYLDQRDGEFLRQCVESDIFAKSSYPFESNAQNGYFWGFANPTFYWGSYPSLNGKAEYEPIPKKYANDLDFRKILELAAEKGDGRAAFYLAMLYELGIMGPKFLANLAGALSENDLNPERLHAYADKKMANKYHEIAAEKCPEFENAYIFLQNYIVTMTDAKEPEASHLVVDLMTVPCVSKIESTLMSITGESFWNFKLFGRFLCAILAGIRAPLPLATMAIGKDLFVSNGFTQGPDVFSGYAYNVDTARVNIVRGQALGYVSRLADEGNNEAQFAKKRYGITPAGKPAASPSVKESVSDSGSHSERKLLKPGNLPGSIFINNVTYNLVSGCDDWATYRSFEGHEVTITYVISLFNGEADTNVGHIRF